jgi:hypothetical protein
LVSSKQIGREDISPENVVLTEGNVQVDGVGAVALSCEHGHGMMKDVTSTLDTLVQPAGSMAFFVEWNRESLSSAVVDCINKSYIEFVWVLSKVMGA